MKRIFTLFLIIFALQSSCFATTNVSFVYLNGSNNNNTKMRNWFLSGIKKFHPTLKNQIEFQCNELENNNSLSSNDQDSATKTKNEIQSKMSNISSQISKAIDTISHVEKTKFSNASVEESNSNTIQVEGRPRDASISQDLKVINLQNNEEILKRRRKDLEEIQQTTHQLKDLTNVMKENAIEQRDNLNSIENHIIEVNDNVEKANQEMVKANELSKKNRNKAILGRIQNG